MTPVFLDTVGLIALWDKYDQWHEAAEKAYESISKARRTAVTTTFILLECGNTAARAPFRKDVCDLRNALESRDELIAPTNEEWSRHGRRISVPLRATPEWAFTFRFS
jgi:predicted nucleic acid-binding protein